MSDSEDEYLASADQVFQRSLRQHNTRTQRAIATHEDDCARQAREIERRRADKRAAKRRNARQAKQAAALQRQEQLQEEEDALAQAVAESLHLEEQRNVLASLDSAPVAGDVLSEADRLAIERAMLGEVAAEPLASSVAAPLDTLQRHVRQAMDVTGTLESEATQLLNRAGDGLLQTVGVNDGGLNALASNSFAALGLSTPTRSSSQGANIDGEEMVLDSPYVPVVASPTRNEVIDLTGDDSDPEEQERAEEARETASMLSEDAALAQALALSMAEAESRRQKKSPVLSKRAQLMAEQEREFRAALDADRKKKAAEQSSDVDNRRTVAAEPGNNGHSSTDRSERTDSNENNDAANASTADVVLNQSNGANTTSDAAPKADDPDYLEAVPAEPESGVNVRFTLPSGKRVVRRLASDNTVQQLRCVVRQELLDADSDVAAFTLRVPMSTVDFSDRAATLSDLQLTSAFAITVVEVDE